MAGFAQSLTSALLGWYACGFSQDRRILQLSTPLGAQALLAECMRAEEEIGRGYHSRCARSRAGSCMVRRNVTETRRKWPATAEQLAG
jgi:hypothetical protein